MGKLGLGVKQHLGRHTLDHLTAVHNGHIVGHLVDDAEIVRDKQDACAVLVLEVVHQPQDLRLNGDIERRCRLVGDQQLGPAGQRHGDHDTLPHTAGKLMRILLGHDLRVGDLDLAQQVDGFDGGLLLGDPLMDHEGLRELPLDGENGVETGHGLLENDRDLVAADLIHFAEGDLGQIDAPEKDLAALDIAVAVKQAQDAHGRNGLAGAGFADYAKRLALLHGIRYVIDGLHDAALGGKVCVQVLDFKQICHNAPLYLSPDLGSSASRSPSPMRLMQTQERPKMRPTNTQFHQ